MFLAYSFLCEKKKNSNNNENKIGVIRRLHVQKEMHFEMWEDLLGIVEKTTRTFKILE